MPQPTGCRPPRAIDSHPGQAILAVEKWYRLHSRVPVSHEILAHGQTQAADQQHAQPPVVEHQGTRHHRRRGAVPVDQQRQDQRGNGDGLGDRDKGVVAQVAHHRPVHAEADEQGMATNGAAMNSQAWPLNGLIMSSVPNLTKKASQRDSHTRVTSAATCSIRL